MKPIERVTLRDCLPARIAASNGCPFCIARLAPAPEIGQRAVLINGSNSGRIVEVSEAFASLRWTGRFLDPVGDHVSETGGSDAYLLAPLPFLPVDWLPHLSIRESFWLDQLAVEMCQTGLSTGNFVWRDEYAVEFAGAVWELRSPVTADEAISCLAAHGLPSIFHDRFADVFDISLKALVSARGRPCQKNRRFKSFADRDANPKIWTQTYVCPTD